MDKKLTQMKKAIRKADDRELTAFYEQFADLVKLTNQVLTLKAGDEKTPEQKRTIQDNLEDYRTSVLYMVTSEMVRRGLGTFDHNFVGVNNG